MELVVIDDHHASLSIVSLPSAQSVLKVVGVGYPPYQKVSFVHVQACL